MADALTVSNIIDFLGPPSTNLQPDQRVNSQSVFNATLADAWANPQAIAVFIRELASKGGIVSHMATSQTVENTSVSFDTWTTRPMLPNVRAEYASSDLASVQTERHQAELEMRFVFRGIS